MAVVCNFDFTDTSIHVEADQHKFATQVASFGEDAVVSRLVSEASPSIDPSSSVSREQISEKISTNDDVEILEDYTASSEHILKVLEYSGSFHRSSASSNHDVEIVEPFQPECEPDFGSSAGGMIREDTDELCWNPWCEMPLPSTMESNCVSLLLEQALPESYSSAPSMQYFAAPAFLGNELIEENLSAQEHNASQKNRYSGRCDSVSGRRHKRGGSLIDRAGKKQGLTSTQPKLASDKRSHQAASAPHSNLAIDGSASRKQHIVRFCHQCGASCKSCKFCMFCGAAVASSP
mmetsp:Transcript_90333/g.141052  ORF Transcript_90333/g.141052 Transcript_90333/m.141052 type:complete len:292 (-) Transcript_90333:440-1315(-)